MSRLLGQDIGVGEQDSKSHLAARIEDLRLVRDKLIVQRDWLGGKLEAVLKVLAQGKTLSDETVRTLLEQLPTYYVTQPPAGVKEAPPEQEQG